MKKIFLVLFIFSISLFANFFVLDNGRIVEIVNEPNKNVQIVGSNGKVLKKHKTLASVKKYKRKLQQKKLRKTTKRYRSKKKYSKKSYVYKKKNYKKIKKYSSKKKKSNIKISKKSKKYKKYSKKIVTKRYKSNKKKKYKKSKSIAKNIKKRNIVKNKRKKIKDLIIIRTNKRILEFYKDGKFKKIYKVAVGKDGWRSYGKFWVRKKVKWPDWVPTKRIKEENPNLPDIVYGGPKNPLGARALYLGYTALRIHGTNNPKSVGKAVSHGCFRMKNKDIIELYDMVKVGTPVYVK